MDHQPTDGADGQPTAGSGGQAVVRRRRPIVTALWVAALAVIGLVAWVQSRPSSPDAERDAALDGLLTFGGPAGWQLSQDPGVPAAGGFAWTQRDGRPVLLGDNGFTVVWSVSPATPDACTALSTWTTSRIGDEAATQVATACPAALARKDGAERVFTSYRTDPGKHGRYLFAARVGGGALFAGLTYERPGAAQ
ncbi:hypothetical protein ACWT_1113 [Actinoplanes sp. SE50]|uniref:hypothetical protein n=1 Tax=Actinoplanes sp. (strain ATCC 31044 / CBS 674.73 / SE50/110) TaxID=134676 RepID=UPI00023ECE09|nr:hypothetical protein [Actinoplanes sp. SE50/110]AEV82129.1 hypothetical protein ACPL_1232 [Actinoplanes sp. SE50/110]ATO80528.1 hypothetical protein ACWT_1113 [Actinoplanes sp. SE50]SLL97934.1 hypothetical protein ACSP50_1150 [Actinoplanes sp. SE50/110]